MRNATVTREYRPGRPRTPLRKTAQLRFLNHFRLHGSIYRALEHAPCSRAHFYAWCKEDPDFAEIYHQIEQVRVDQLEESAFQRAFKDTSLTQFLLKAHRPKTYRDDAIHTVEKRLVIVCTPEVAKQSAMQMVTHANGNGNS